MKANFNVKVICNHCNKEFVYMEKFPFGFNWSAKGIVSCPQCNEIIKIRVEHKPNFSDSEYLNGVMEGIFYMDSQTLCE